MGKVKRSKVKRSKVKRSKVKRSKVKRSKVKRTNKVRRKTNQSKMRTRRSFVKSTSRKYRTKKTSGRNRRMRGGTKMTDEARNDQATIRIEMAHEAGFTDDQIGDSATARYGISNMGSSDQHKYRGDAAWGLVNQDPLSPDKYRVMPDEPEKTGADVARVAVLLSDREQAVRQAAQRVAAEKVAAEKVAERARFQAE